LVSLLVKHEYLIHENNIHMYSVQDRVQVAGVC